MADEAKKAPPPASDKKDGEGDKKEDTHMEKSLDARFSRVEGLLEKTAEAIGSLAQRQDAYEKNLSLIASRLSKEVPPKSMDSVEGGVDHDPTPLEHQNKNERSADAATKPATPTTETSGAFVKKDAGQPPTAQPRISIAKAVELEVAKRLDAVLKGSTPIPGAPGAAPTGPEAQFAFMRKAVAEDRKICGGEFNTGGGEHFGLRAGTGNASSREQMARFMTKSAPWNTGFGG